MHRKPSPARRILLTALMLCSVCCFAAAQRIPIPAGFPNAATTGHSGTLTPSGSITVTTAGTVLQNLDISGGVQIKAHNVTIRNCRIVGGLYGVNASFGYTGLVVEDCTVYNGDSKGIYGANMIVRRCDISMYSDCMMVQSNVLVEDSYLHDLKITAGSHNDGIQCRGGSNITVRHCTIQAQYQNQTAALIFQTETRGIDNVLFENNFLSGGTYTVYLRDPSSYGPPTNVRLIGNVFEYDGYQFGHLSVNGTHTYICNIFHTGVPIPQNAACDSLPTADAGPDQTIPDADGNGLEQVQLDGSGSTCPDGAIIGYLWTEGGAYVGSGVSPMVAIMAGAHTIELKVAADAGDTDTDTVVIDVTAAPRADAGVDQTLVDADGDGFEVVILDGSASAPPSGETLTQYMWTDAGSLVGLEMITMTVVPVGVHTITLEVTDSTGAKATDDVVISVEAATQPGPGDADGDGDVDLDDFVILKANFGSDTATRSDGDFDADGDVDLDDFTILKVNFGS